MASALNVLARERVHLSLLAHHSLWPTSEMAVQQLKVPISHSQTLVQMSRMSPKLLEESQVLVSKLLELAISLRDQAALHLLLQALLLWHRPQR
jgi:hypothetical protein